MDQLTMERLVKPLWGDGPITDKVAIPTDADLVKYKLKAQELTGIYGQVNPLLVEVVMSDTRFLKCSCGAEVTMFEVDGLDVTKRLITQCVKCK